jgi:hypothetical protein
VKAVPLSAEAQAAARLLGEEAIGRHHWHTPEQHQQRK